jgi:hypothetical protein
MKVFLWSLLFTSSLQTACYIKQILSNYLERKNMFSRWIPVKVFRKSVYWGGNLSRLRYGPVLKINPYQKKASMFGKELPYRNRTLIRDRTVLYKTVHYCTTSACSIYRILRPKIWFSTCNYFYLKHGFAITMDSDVILNPQWWQICVIYWINWCLIKIRHLGK